MVQSSRSVATRRRVILAAERLFAESGIEAVTLRDIGRAAGQRNNSVVHYHFRTKDALVEEAMVSRYGVINQRRNEMLDRLVASNTTRDVRAIVNATVAPFAELLDGDGEGRPLGFLAQLISLPRYAQMAIDNEQVVGAMVRARDLLTVALAEEVPSSVLQIRFNVAAMTTVHAFAAVEARRLARVPDLPPSVLVANLVDAQAGLFTAPVSSDARSAEALVGASS